MGLHPKIGITGLPRSGKSAVMEKVLGMLSWRSIWRQSFVSVLISYGRKAFLIREGRYVLWSICGYVLEVGDMFRYQREAPFLGLYASGNRESLPIRQLDEK